MDDNAKYALAGMVVVAVYYYWRAERVKQLQKAQVASQSVGQQEKHSSKFAFTSMSQRINDPTVWKINEPGYAREGQFGLERRDYIDEVGGTHVVTHTDQFVNV